MMLVLMSDPRFKDLSILNNYVGIRKQQLSQQFHPFVKHLSNSNTQEQPLEVFGARLIQDQILMEHISFLVFPITCVSF